MWSGGARAEARPLDQEPEPKARPDLVRQPYSDADVEFMAGMIPHHAQAVLIAGWAASHGARPDIRVLCERMVVGQRDEIAFDAQLAARPRRDGAGRGCHASSDEDERRRARHADAGHAQPRELAELDKARGPEWDRLFLTFMIRHHEGALKMVDELFASTARCRMTTSTSSRRTCRADQTIEIERMQKMLAALGKAQPAMRSLVSIHVNGAQS